MVYEARYLAWNCELKTRLSDVVSHLRNNCRQIVTQQLKKNVFLRCHFKMFSKPLSPRAKNKQLTLKWLSGARAQDKSKQYYCFVFFLILFNYAIQGKFITWLVNSALNCPWKPMSQSSLRDFCDIGFRVQFSAEFPRQVMNFPIECSGVWACYYSTCLLQCHIQRETNFHQMPNLLSSLNVLSHSSVGKMMTIGTLVYPWFWAHDQRSLKRTEKL